MQNFVAIGSGLSAPQIRDFAVPFDVTSFYVRFLGPSMKLQPTRLNNILRKIHQNIGVGDGGRQQGRSPPRFQVGGRKYLSAPQVLSLKNTNKEALSTPQPLSSNYHE